MYDNLDIITIGESLIELSSDKPLAFADTFTKYYGGDTLAVAVSALRSGAKTGYITKVKNDGFGEYLLDCWQSEGLDSGQVKFADLQNGIYFAGQKNNMVEMQFYRQKTAASELRISDIDFEYIKSAKMIFATAFVQSLSLSCREVVREVFKFAKENGILTGYYPNFAHTGLSFAEAKEMFEEIQGYIDTIFINTKDNLLFETESPDLLIKKLADMQLENSLIIKNDEGIWSSDRTEVSFIKSLEFSPVDLTGYTSAVIGAYIALRIKGETRLNALRYANILGMMQAMKVGAIRSIPYEKDVKEMIKRYYEC
ncbi:MAG: sugar kinase [Candidatus Gastranaerophilales bacterium]|nr:sugar kinase [Candidatus Gastranaerophilales bacterium]